MAKSVSKRERVVKGYYVEALLDDDLAVKPHKVSHNYMCLSAANDMAEHFRKHVKRPELVSVRTRYGYDDAAGICGVAIHS